MQAFNLDKLKAIINTVYSLKITSITHIRSMIGHVYKLHTHSRHYLLKMYNPIHHDDAIHGFKVQTYLYQQGFNVPKVIKTNNNEIFYTITHDELLYTLVITEYIKGHFPNLNDHLKSLGTLTALMHKEMQSYDNNLRPHGKSFYVDRFISILKTLNYDLQKTHDLERLGNTLWNQVKALPKGFCHGDLHSNNIIKTTDNTYYFIDFDAASLASSLVDVASIINKTDFNHLKEQTIDLTLKAFDRFYEGYKKQLTLTDEEIKAWIHFVPLRHYELIATIGLTKGIHTLGQSFLDEQYHWLMKWQFIMPDKKQNIKN